MFDRKGARSRLVEMRSEGEDAASVVNAFGGYGLPTDGHNAIIGLAHLLNESLKIAETALAEIERLEKENSELRRLLYYAECSECGLAFGAPRTGGCLEAHCVEARAALQGATR